MTAGAGGEGERGETIDMPDTADTRDRALTADGEGGYAAYAFPFTLLGLRLEPAALFLLLKVGLNIGFNFNG